MPTAMPMKLLLVGLVVMAGALGVACNPSPTPGGTAPSGLVDDGAIQALPWVGRGGLIDRDCCGDTIWGVSGHKSKELLECWKWQAGLLEKAGRVEFAEKFTVFNVALAGGGRFFTHEDYGGPDTWLMYALVARDIESHAEVGRWEREVITESTETRISSKTWNVRQVHSSANGNYVALAYQPEDGGGRSPLYKIRLLQAAALTMSDAIVLGGDGKYNADCVRRVVPSDDGAYVAVAGWNNGVAMIDVKQKKVLWSIRPPSEVSTKYAVFGPGNEVIYAGGSEGCVYEMAVADGKILGRWFASPTGKSEYGHRISAITLSPDGKYVAAGTGPQGLVFVIEPKTGKTVKVLNHGGSTISLVHFSPDSKRLASFAAGVLKVWQIAPPEPTEAAPVPAPRATPKPGERHDE